MKINKMSKLKAFTNKQGYLSQPNKIILENENMLFVGYENKFVACFDRRTGRQSSNPKRQDSEGIHRPY